MQTLREVVYGETRKPELTGRLLSSLGDTEIDGTVYLGYPVLASADDRVEIDALIVSSNHGLIAFQLSDEPLNESNQAAHVEAQDRMYGVLDSTLRRHDRLRRGRSLAFDIHTITVFPYLRDTTVGAAQGYYCTEEEVAGILRALPSIDPGIYTSLQAAFQRVSTIKPPRRRTRAVNSGSRGSILKAIEKEIANLDRWQKRAAIESPAGPQRIRGLAGSGKTIVLALKAAYLHAQNPEWQVALTFQSQALYEQLEDLVTRFSFEHSNDQPDDTHLQIMHAWGSRGRLGVYSRMALALGADPRDYNYASATWGRDDAFKGACAELLAIARGSAVEPIFDAVLIDEAQDLPPEFFQLVWLFTRNPKRIVWGYDELQRLTETAMPSIDELFGKRLDGRSQVELHNLEDQARQDILLPTCYRNTPWNLATAHAMGFGIYREQGLVQHFDDPKTWTEIGYQVVSGSLTPGQHVVLERAPSASPGYFSELLTAEDAVIVEKFADQTEQDAWVAAQIKANIERDELEYEDILIVLPSAYTAKRRSVSLASALSRLELQSHLVGVDTARDEVFRPGSVAIAHIYRAKGNEAAMVYAVDAHQAIGQYNEVTRRNTLFTAMTRSKAWIRVTGHGASMDSLIMELNAVKHNGYRLRLTIPTQRELAEIRRVSRDRSDAEVAAVEQASRYAKQLLETLGEDHVDLQDMPRAVVEQLLARLAQRRNQE